MSITHCDEFLLRKYEAFLWGVTNRFIARGGWSLLPIRDDLYMEVCLTFLKWMSRHKDATEETVVNATFDLNHSMYAYAAHNIGMCIDRRRLKDFYEQMRDTPVISIQECENVEDDSLFGADTVVFRIEFARWLKTLSALDHKIVMLRLAGYANPEIASKIGTTPRNVNKILRHRIRENYNQYMREIAS